MKTMTRRMFLRGTGGVVLGLPYLTSLLPRGARAQELPPKRLVLVSVGHSVNNDDNHTAAWVSQSSGGALTQLSPILAPLEPWRARLVQVLGVDNAVTRMCTSNGHNANSRTLLTCMPHAEALDGGALRSNYRDLELSWSSSAGGPSIDYVLASRLGQDPLVLRCGEPGAEHHRNTRLNNTQDHGKANPRAVFDEMFGAVEPTIPTAADLLRRHRKSILDAVLDDFTGLLGRVGSQDRQRLEQHADHIRDFEQRLGSVVTVTCDNPALDASGLPTSFEQPAGPNDDLIAQAHNDLVALALSCSSTRVVSLHYSNFNDNQFPFLNGGERLIPAEYNWHGVTHLEFGTDEMRLTAKRWYSTMLADLLTKLDDPQEENGSVLDNTVVVWVSSLSTSSHGANNLPLLLTGAVPSQGQLIDYRADRRTLGDLWTTVLQMFGQNDAHFGWNTPIAGLAPFNTGPLAELL